MSWSPPSQPHTSERHGLHSLRPTATTPTPTRTGRHDTTVSRGGHSPGDPEARTRTLIDQYLQEQRNSSAVDRFSRWHETARPSSVTGHYHRLLPATPPGAGEQYAFEVDLDACSGCKACVTACHSLNGLEHGETWRSVGLLVDPTTSRGAPQHVTTACHHCIEPGCLHGCPVLAYEKDPTTGIVRHLDDQCMGCNYCTWTCPYEVPRYSSRLGIVRKCDLCHGRLSNGEAPACAQGCPNEAIRISVVSTQSVRSSYSTPSLPDRIERFLPDSPDPAATIPTTRYASRSGRASAFSAVDRFRTVPAPSHAPLVVFLVLSQFSVGWLGLGAFAVDSLVADARLLFLPALALQGIALAAATFHLGKPLRAWRAFLGWRRSWFSREVLAFGAYTFLLAVASINVVLPAGTSLHQFHANARPLLVLLGVAGVFTSVMIYHATDRAYWNGFPTAIRFFGTTGILGSAVALPPEAALPAVLILQAIKWIAESRLLASDASELQASRSLLQTTLRPGIAARAIAFFLGVAGLVALLDAPATATPWVLATTMGFLGCAELVERHLFFVAVAPKRMPGGSPR